MVCLLTPKVHYNALNRALDHFGYNISLESHLSTFDGLPTKKKLDILTASLGLPKGLHSFLNDLKQVYTIEITHQCCKPSFNHQYALSQLKREGYKIGVCSNSIRNTIETMMKLSSLDSYLDVLFQQDVAEATDQMYLKAMNILDVSSDECLILEDNEHGMIAARASGGHLMKIGVPDNVTYQSIKSTISQINHG